MPLLWRYLLVHYLKVLCLSVIAFVMILLTTRLGEIAHFVTLGSEGVWVFWFILYQIPYILPLAIPLSSLISAVILVQRLSISHELTAFRASGLSMRQIFAPILSTAFLLSFLNFYIVSELATHCHLESTVLKAELRTINPLLLLHNKHLMRLKGFFFDTLGSSRMGENASEVILAMPNRHNNRIQLLLAKDLKVTPQLFKGKGLTLISSIDPEETRPFDHLMIENISEIAISTEDFSQLIKKKILSVSHDYLSLPLLKIRLKDQNFFLNQAQLDQKPPAQIKQLKRSINSLYSEFVRRISISLAVFTFTLMGVTFGVTIGRHRSRKGLYLIVILATFFIVSFFAAKSVSHLWTTSSFLYLLPHFLMIFCSIRGLQRLSKGVGQ